MTPSRIAGFNRSSRRIVVIEDSPDLAEMAVMLLEMEGYAARCALTGRAGLALVAAHPTHGVLLDYMLPDMTGAAVGRQLRAMAAVPRLAIFMCTSTLQATVQADFSDYDGFFAKPVSHERMIHALDKALATQ